MGENPWLWITKKKNHPEDLKEKTGGGKTPNPTGPFENPQFPWGTEPERGSQKRPGVPLAGFSRAGEKKVNQFQKAPKKTARFSKFGRTNTPAATQAKKKDQRHSKVFRQEPPPQKGGGGYQREGVQNLGGENHGRNWQEDPGRGTISLLKGLLTQQAGK